jgi:hypothetical protein
MKPKTGIGILKSIQKPKLSGLDKYVIFSFAMLIIYSIIEFVVSSVTGVSHDVLTTCFFAAFGGETLWCAILKKHKLKRGDG